MEGGLQQPDPGGLSLARAVKHGAHQPSPDRLVLQRRMNRDRPDARDRPTFVEKITTEDLSFLLGHYRVEARIRQHHRQETRRYLCGWKIPGEIVSIVDCLECFEADWAADSGIGGCTRSQHHAHGSPCAELALYSRSFIGCHGPTPLRLRLRGEDCALPLRRTIDGARYGMISTARKRVTGVTVGAAVPKLAMRTGTDKLKACIVRLAVDQNEVWPDVAVAVIAPLAAERMIELAPRQRLILRQHPHGRH